MISLTTARLHLNFPRLEDLSALAYFEKSNRDHLARWESTVISEEADRAKLENWIKECKEGTSARFLLRLKSDPSEIIGFCNFTQIFYGPFRACYLGYKIDHRFEGQGLMFEAVQRGLQYIFEDLKLHRVMANYMPINTRSENLLRRLGFQIEGYAKNYLLINNRWEDHVLTALTFEQWHSIDEKVVSD